MAWRRWTAAGGALARSWWFGDLLERTIDGPISIERMADDLAALLDAVGLEEPPAFVGHAILKGVDAVETRIQPLMNCGGG